MSHAHFDHAQLDSLIVFQATEYACLLSASSYAAGAVEYHWPLSKLPIGRLPGDVVVDRPGFKLFAPFTTMIIVSLVVSLIVWLLRR